MEAFYVDNYARYEFFKELSGDRTDVTYICELPSLVESITLDGKVVTYFSDEAILKNKSLNVFMWNGLHRFQLWFAKNFNGKIYFIEHANAMGLYQFSDTGTNGRLGKINENHLKYKYSNFGIRCPNIFHAAENLFATDPFGVSGRGSYRRSYFEYTRDYFFLKKNKKKIEKPEPHKVIRGKLPTGKRILFLGQTASDTTTKYDAFTDLEFLLRDLILSKNEVFFRPHPASEKSVSRLLKRCGRLKPADNSIRLDHQAESFEEVHSLNSSAAVKLRSYKENVFLHGISFAHAIESCSLEYLVSHSKLSDLLR